MTVNSVTTDYTYNSLDQLISAGSITYDYDDRGNLSTITNGSNITNYTYDAAELNDRFDYKTSDTSSASQRPKLVIEYTTSAPATPTPTPTATATATPTATANATPTATATDTPTPTPNPGGPVTINYVYDALNRLTESNYSNGDYYHYAYDAVGNRETQQKSVLGFVTNDTYVYDDANRLTSLNGVNYSWDNNGNLLNDGVNTYTYDSANRLKTFTNASTTASYAYSGLGDRLQETVNGNTTTFTMDLNTGLTQALSDGTNTYIYGNGRIAQASGTGTEYFLGDALGSLRQLTNASGAITYARAYDPYGVVTSTSGGSSTAYGYTSEYTSQGLVYLRARHYAPGMGRFFQKDPSGLEQNTYRYASANPVNFSDPSGLLFWAFRSGTRADLLGNPRSYIRNNNFAHPWIEYWVEQNNGFWNTQAEFAGGNSYKIDLIVFDRTRSRGFGSSPLDFGGNSVTGSVFEIEPAYIPAKIIEGYGEILGKWADISNGTPPFVHDGFLPKKDYWPTRATSITPFAGYEGAPYHWSNVNWQLGTSLSPSAGMGPVRVDPNEFGISGISGIPNAYWAMLVVPGLILYVDERTLREAGIALASLPVANYIYKQYKRARERPDGGKLPEPGWAPGYSQLDLQPVDPNELFDFDSTCSTPNFLEQLFPWLVPFPIPLQVSP